MTALSNAIYEKTVSLLLRIINIIHTNDNNNIIATNWCAIASHKKYSRCTEWSTTKIPTNTCTRTMTGGNHFVFSNKPGEIILLLFLYQTKINTVII